MDSVNISTARYALPADLMVLGPLRELLGDLPTVFPTAADRRIRPLAIGIDKHLVELASERGVDADAEQAAVVVRQVLRRYCRSRTYIAATNQPDAMRHALNGTAVEPVATEHKGWMSKPQSASAGQASPTSPATEPVEPFVMSLAVKAIKVTVVLDPQVLRPAPAGADVILEVTTEGGIKAQARVNPKSYRKALDAIREHGADNVAVILQGRMVKPGEIVDAGIAAQSKPPKP
jgi:ProQ/FINO family